MAEYNIQMNRYVSASDSYDQLFPKTKTVDVVDQDNNTLDTLLNNKQNSITASGILKGNGAGGVSAAVAGTDFAPGGFGLGAVSYNAIADCNDTTLGNGFYTLSAATLNYPALIPNASYGILLVQIRGTSIYQSFSYGEYFAKRRYTGATWTEWEYVNPPMLVGVEYRTTERYLGKPVYVKLVDCGYLPNATNKTVAYSDDTNCRPIWGCGHTGTSTFPSLNFGSTMATSLATADNVSLWILNNNISIACGGDRSTIRAYVIVKYYKTTD